MLQWHTKEGWTHRAYWGENVIDWGKDGTPERLPMGGLPPLGKWVRLEVPVAKLAMAPGTVIDGWAFTQYGGTVYWDKAGIETGTPQDGQLFDSFTAWVRAQRASAGAGLPDNVKTLVRDRSSQADRGPDQGASQLLLRACVFQDGRDLRDPAIQAGRGRKKAETDRRANPHDAGLS